MIEFQENVSIDRRKGEHTLFRSTFRRSHKVTNKITEKVINIIEQLCL